MDVGEVAVVVGVIVEVEVVVTVRIVLQENERIAKKDKNTLMKAPTEIVRILGEKSDDACAGVEVGVGGSRSKKYVIFSRIRNSDPGPVSENGS